MKILISAFACQPNKGSEPGVGWNWIKALAKYNDIYVVTRKENKEPIEDYIDDNEKNIHIIYHGNKLAEVLKKYIPFGNHLYCSLWQRTVIKKLKKLNNELKFDICHHITYASFKYPNFLYKLNIPMIIGPVGGGEITPKSLKKSFNIKNKIFEFLREFQSEMSKENKNIKRTFNKAEKIFVTTEETLECVPEIYRSKTEVLQTIGIEENEVLDKEEWLYKKKDKRFNILFVGQVKMWKGINIILKVAEILNTSNNQYLFNIVGDGPDIKYLKNQVRKSRLEGMFNFKGKVSRKEVLELYENNNLFLFPSYHDSGAMVVLEAMSKNIPVLVLDTGGPGVIVSDDAGFKIDKNQSYSDIINDFVEKIRFIETLYDTGKIEKYIYNANKLIREKYTWGEKAKVMSEKYDEVFAKNKE